MCVAPERFRYAWVCVFILGYYRLGGPGRRGVIPLPIPLFKEGRKAELSNRVRTHHANMDHRGPETGLL